MNRQLSVVICTLLSCCFFAAAQKSANIKPKWLGNTPGSPETEYYFVEVHSDAYSSLTAARIAIKQEIASNVERVDQVSVSEVIEGHSNQYYDTNGEITSTAIDTYSLLLNVDGVARPIKSRRIDEYWEIVDRGGNKNLVYYALFAVERKDAIADFSTISSVSSYGAHGLWRSAIVPGWGQFYKGSNIKGGLILGGTVAFVGGIIYTESMRQDYMNKINKTHNTNNMRAYKTRADNFAMGRNICIGGLAALYVYNIIDAIVAPGARHIVVRKNANGSGYAVVPTIGFDRSAGIAALITF